MHTGFFLSVHTPVNLYHSTGLGGASDARPASDQEVVGSIPAVSGSIFSLTDPGIFYAGHSLLFADSRRVVVSFW